MPATNCTAWTTLWALFPPAVSEQGFSLPHAVGNSCVFRRGCKDEPKAQGGDDSKIQNHMWAYWAELGARTCICTFPDLYNSHSETWELSKSRALSTCSTWETLEAVGSGGRCLGIEGTMEVWGGWVAASVLLVTELVTITWAWCWQVQHPAPELSELKLISLWLLPYCFFFPLAEDTAEV